MVFEAPKIEEISRDIYALSRDGDLSESEKTDILQNYEQEVQQIQTQTQVELQELRRFMEIFENVETLLPEEKIQLQMILGIDRSQRDGIFGPATFQKFITFQNESSYPGLPKNLIILYNDYKTRFEQATSDEQKNYQRVGEQDGKYGPNTFRYMLSQDISQPITPTIQQEDIQEVLPEISGVAESGEETEVGDLSRVSGDQHPDESAELSESEEEKIQRLIQEAKDTSNILIRQLQTHLEGITVDGVFGPQSVAKLLEIYPDIGSIAEAFEKAGINTNIDGVLSQNGDPEVFRNLYGPFIEQLGNDLGLPQGFIEAIIRKETTYGADLFHESSSSHGLMQLTRWPFKDMRGDTVNGERRDAQKVRLYQEIFQRIDVDALLAVKIGEQGIAETQMPENIITAFRTIQTSQNIEEIQDSISLLYEYLKRSGSDFHDHEANMIIGSVYLAYQYEANNRDIWKTAYDYNGNADIAQNGREVRQNYADTVQRYFEELQP